MADMFSVMKNKKFPPKIIYTFINNKIPHKTRLQNAIYSTSTCIMTGAYYAGTKRDSPLSIVGVGNTMCPTLFWGGGRILEKKT